MAAGGRSAPGGSGLFVIPVDGDEPRRVAQPKGQEKLSSPALAPDGHRLAYMTCMATSGGPSCGVDVMDLDDRPQPVSSPRPLVAGVAPGGLVWSPDGASVLYTMSPVPQMFYLWRAWVDGGRAPERVELAGLGACMPALSAKGNRLAFSRVLNSAGVYTLESPRHARCSSPPSGTFAAARLTAPTLSSPRRGRASPPTSGSRPAARFQCAPVDARTRDLAGLAVLVARRASHRLRREATTAAAWRSGPSTPTAVPAGSRRTRRSKHADVVARRALDLLHVQHGGQERHVAGARQRRISRACHARGECVLCNRID